MEWRIIIRKGLSTRGNLRFKIDCAGLIVGSKFTVFALFYFVSEGNFPSIGPPRGEGGYIWRGDLMEDFLRYRFEGAYIWRGLYIEGLIFGILCYQDSQSKGGPETLRTAHRIGLENNG